MLSETRSRCASPRAATAVVAAIAAAAFGLLGCGASETGSSEAAANRRALTLVAAGETEPVRHAGDAADDPAIWIHPRDRRRSTIIATDKKGGLAVYDLSGRELQYLADGEMNNVDLRGGFPLGDGRVTLVAASDRTDDTIALYRVDEGMRRLSAVASFRAGITVYGLCMYRGRRSGAFYVFVDSKSGDVEQWQLLSRNGALTARRVRSFDVGSDVEGCVADDGLGHLYVGEEKRGIWKYGAEPRAGTRRTLVDSTGRDGHLTADVEGLAIAYGPGGTGVLVASSQGNDTFAVYRRQGDNEFVRTFRVGGGRRADDVQDTDGIDVTTAGLGPRFRAGLFVAQDGRNDGGNQNFKLVPWRRVR